MRNKLDNILLGVLWLLATTLGASFWFNTKFGFNIFSSAHWNHLAYMQAAQNPVTPAFYISMVIAVCVGVFGLYVLIRPRFRRIQIPVRDVSTPTQQTQIPTPMAPLQTATPQTPSTNTTIPASAPTTPPRPPRLNVIPTPLSHTTPTQNAFSTPVVATPPQQTEWPELREIFENAGYTVKKNPRIAGTQIALMAIGTNEVLWIGTVGTPTDTMAKTVDTINQIFSDTLDDVYIDIRPFIISAPDAATPTNGDILLFDTTSDLRDYIIGHQNPPIPADDNGNFDAFSAYISTVIEYVGKL